MDRATGSGVVLPWLARRLLGDPALLVFFVTRRCNLACPHCLVQGLPCPASSPGGRELDADEVRRMARTLPRLLEVTLTGGEPFLREDLLELALPFVLGRRTRRLNVVTNGAYGDRVAAFVEGLLRTPLQHLGVQVSLDGPPGVHDRLRAMPGAHEQAVETFLRVRGIARRDRRLRVGTITTWQPGNRDVLDGYLPFLQSLEPDTLSLNLLRGPVGAAGVDASRLPDYERTYRAWLGANASAFRRAYKSMILDLQVGRQSAACTAGAQVAVLRETGELYGCEPSAAKMGDLRECGLDFRRAWNGASAREVRRFARRECGPCTWECVLPFNLFTGWRQVARLGFRTVVEWGAGRHPQG